VEKTFSRKKGAVYPKGTRKGYKKFGKKMVESWLSVEYNESMKHQWLFKCLVLSFLIFSIAPSFHCHDHGVIDSNCHLCMLALHPLQFILQDSFQLPVPICETLPLLAQKQDIFFSTDRNILCNRSPPA
jgi:hypothetical protein